MLENSLSHRYKSDAPMQEEAVAPMEEEAGPASAIPDKWKVDTESSKTALREVLGRSASQLADILREWDVDGSGTIEKREFIKAFNLIGARTADNWATDKTGAGALFDELDRDHSGYLDIDEIRFFQRDRGPNEVKMRGGEIRQSKGYQGALPSFTLDQTSSDSITAQVGRASFVPPLPIVLRPQVSAHNAVTVSTFPSAAKLSAQK